MKTTVKNRAEMYMGAWLQIWYTEPQMRDRASEVIATLSYILDIPLGKMKDDPRKYIEKFRPDLMEIVNKYEASL